MILILCVLAFAAVLVVAGVVFIRQQRTTRSGVLTHHRARTRSGTLFRFASVTELITFCRDRYRTDKVQCSSDSGEHLLSVDPFDRKAFDSLVVYFEIEGQYAVLLPDL